MYTLLAAIVISEQTETTSGLREEVVDLMKNSIKNLEFIPDFLLRLCIVFGKPACFSLLLLGKEGQGPRSIPEPIAEIFRGQ